MLSTEAKTQLDQYLKMMEGPVVIKTSVGEDKDMADLLDEISAMSDLITLQPTNLPRTPSFTIGERITFAGVPMGHEFVSLIMALLQVSGRKPKVDDKIIDQIKDIREEYNFETYISLSCHNCPDVVQALNIMAVINPNITNVMIDGGSFKTEVDEKDIMAVPSVYLNGEFFESGKQTIEEILAKLGSKADTSDIDGKEFDVLIIGGGPAGASAAIYSARKGIRTGIVSERFGGQVADTMGIENLIGVSYTEGPKLVAQIESHVKDYDVDIMNVQRVTKIEKGDIWINVELESGAKIKTRTAIIATGARWRELGVPGEAGFKNKGVAYCPHCDGPLFKGKHVAVIGGGNSGIEAAIDLAGIVGHVTVFEFMPELKADEVLQKKLKTLKNVDVITNAETKEINGDTTVKSLDYLDRGTKETKQIKLDGVFIQIGLIPNTEWLDNVDKTKFGEIKVNSHGATSMPRVFAAGDCTDIPYKQIVIALGHGSQAALGAFDYLIRN